MELTGKAKKLKIIVSVNDVVYQKPLYEAIVFAAKKYKLRGATVFRGILSYGAVNLSESQKVFKLSESSPAIIEIIDIKTRINDFAEIAVGLIKKADSAGIAYIEDVDVLFYPSHDN